MSAHDPVDPVTFDVPVSPVHRTEARDPVGSTAAPPPGSGPEPTLIDDPAAESLAAATPLSAPAGRRSSVVFASIALVAIMAGGAMFMSGYALGRQSAAEPGTPASEAGAFVPFWDTYHTITDRYAGGPVDREVLVQGAIKGMIGALGDPFSAYLTSDEYRQSLQGISGEFEGIGVDIASQAPDGTPGCATLGPTCQLVIVTPLDGSPAQKAGLLAGDRVLAADGVPFDGLTIDGARSKIRGPKGSIVALTVQRGAAAAFRLEVARDVIQQQEVVSKALADGAIGYVKLNSFSDRGAADLASALADHVAAGRTAIILDLRGNPGGYVTAARAVASQFIGSGPIFYEQNAAGNQIATDAIGGGAAIDPAIRVMCLIDGGSASASEIVAGALQDTGRATLVGQQSYGKGTVQQWQELTGENGAFRITIAKWLTPEKRWIHGVGLKPDVVVDMPAPVPAGTDPILDRAVDVLGGGGAVPVSLIDDVAA